ncbi:hypothetical protein [Streptomyces sp. NPDC091879]|uniref:hypothetical protein n=1 Tax=Streptomyces sp. NPDC091879 TaxID=3366006 RepID=UPI0038020350
MNTTRRDGADDTGEQDVRELRRLFGRSLDDTPTRPEPDYLPFVRDKEDVPHEDALPDFYGLDNASEEDDEVTEELLQMVEDGELCFGWLEDRQEFGFWFPEEEPADLSLEIPDAPPEPVKGSRRRPKRPLFKRAFLALAATVAAPFAIGLCSYAAEEGEHHAHHPVDRPDLVSDDVDTDDVREMSDRPAVPLDRPAASTYTQETRAKGKHAKTTTKPEKATTTAPTGKHRKVTATPSPSAAPSKAPAHTVKVPAAAPSPSATATHHSGAVGTVVNSVLGPVVSLLGG